MPLLAPEAFAAEKTFLVLAGTDVGWFPNENPPWAGAAGVNGAGAGCLALAAAVFVPVQAAGLVSIAVDGS